MNNCFRKTAFAFSVIIAGALYINAQDVDVQSDGSNSGIVLQGKNINPNSSDKIGVKGLSEPAPWYGIGVVGQGGYVGIRGNATLDGEGSRTGVSGRAGNRNPNYGVFGYAYGGCQ